MATSGAGSSSVGSELPDDISHFLSEAYQNFSPWPPRVSTTATQLEINFDAIDDVNVHKLDDYLHSDKDVSQSDDSTFGWQLLQINPSTSENEASQQPPGAVDQKNSLPIASDKRAIKNHKKATRGEQASETLSRREVVSQSDDSAIDVQTNEKFRESRGILPSETSSDQGDMSQSDDQFVNENHEEATHGEQASETQAKGLCPFFRLFVCDYLLKRADAGDYVELSESPPVIRLKDLDEISRIYCDYKDRETNSGRKRSREKKKRLDNIKNTIKLYEKGQPPSLTRVGSGIVYGKEFLMCEIKDSALWCSLKRSFRLMEQKNSRANRNGPSSDTSRLDVSQSDDSTFDLQSLQINPSRGENEASQQPPGAVDEKNLLTITPDKCPIKGGCTFNVSSDKPVPNGTYDVKFGEYGTCEASVSDNKLLKGSEKIPPATRRGTHSVEVQIFDKLTSILIGKTELEYVDDEATELKDVMHVKNPSLRKDGSDHHNERRRPTKKSSSDSIDGAGSNKRFKKFKNCPIDMPLLVYLCDEMAKSGDKHFFSALIKFGIMGKVLENRCEYFKDFAITAQEHDHSELAKTIEMSSRDVSDQLTETLTFGMLLDAVQTERSLENSDSVHSSDSDDDPNSCSSGYNGDSEDCNGVHSTYTQENSAGQRAQSPQIQDQNEEKKSVDDVIILESQPLADVQFYMNENFEENVDNADVVYGDCNSECDGDSNGVRITHTQENSTGQSAPSSPIRDRNEEKKSEDDVSHEQGRNVFKVFVD